jgi:aspartyl-tRNA(Asn)/glutamyl-tRNA(Gln) amidotransferase subunit C
MKFHLKHLALLAKLNIPKDQQETLTKDLEEILGFVDILQKVKAAPKSGVKSLTGLINVTRPDEPRQVWSADIADTLLGEAPETKKRHIVVERVIEK